VKLKNSRRLEKQLKLPKLLRLRKQKMPSMKKDVGNLKKWPIKLRLRKKLGKHSSRNSVRKPSLSRRLSKLRFLEKRNSLERRPSAKKWNVELLPKKQLE
jgi:hypothetical protein